MKYYKFERYNKNMAFILLLNIILINNLISKKLNMKKYEK